jgi:hypothetical protein
MPEDGSPANGLEGSQGQTWPRNETPAIDEVKPNVKRSLEEVTGG